MNKPRILLLNSPANVGKSKAMGYMKQKGLNLTYASCKEPLHKATMSLFGVPEERYWEIYNDRKLKEIPLPEFRIRSNVSELGRLSEVTNVNQKVTPNKFCELPHTLMLSIRESMIYTSEVIMKPRFGSDVFGRIRANSLEDGKVYIDDSTAAFDVNGEIRADEITPLIERVGQDNILLIRIHREGFDFSGDSRRYVPDGVCDNTVDINNVNELDFYEEVYHTVTTFLEEG